MTAPELMTDHPSDETMAAYIDGRLDRDSQGQVVVHLADCGECTSVVIAADDYRQNAAGAVAIFPRRWFIPAAAAAAAIVIVVFGMLLRPTRMEQVVEASESLQYRPSNARLSADFPHRPAKPIYRGAPKASKYDSSHAELWRLMAKSPKSPEDRHALGVVYLLDDQPEDAVTTLEQALREQTGETEIFKAIRRSENAALLNDLGAAYQTLVERKHAYEVQPLAVEAVQSAWNLEKTPQIAWTRAVVIEGLHIRETAIRAWQDYLALDPGSDWREEAQNRLKKLEQPTDADLWPATRDRLSRGLGREREAHAAVNRFRQEVRVWCEEELLPQWGRAVLAGDPSAADRLQRMAVLGRILENVNRERDVIDAVEAIQRADAAQVRQLARGHIAYGAGRAAIVNGAGATAVQELDVAVASLTPALTPFAWRARAEHAAAVHTDERYADALDELRVLAEQVRNPSRVLTGRIEWVNGIASLRSRSPQKAVEHYLLALSAFGAAGETNAQAGLHTRLSAAYRELGKAKEARDHDRTALQLLGQSGDARRRHEVLFEAAYTAIRNDQPALADLLLDTVVAYDVASRNPVTACTSLMWRGTYLLRLGAKAEAADDLRDARGFCNSIADKSGRERALANLGLAESMVGAEANLADLNASIAYYERTQSRDWLRTAYVVRAGALQSRGDVQAAERDFQAALREMTVTRKEISEHDSRVAFTATADEVADRYVEFLLQQGRTRAAFDVADRSRARELVDSPSARWQIDAPESATESIQSALPPGLAVLEYRVLHHRIVAWVIGATTFETATLSVAYPEIERMLVQLDSSKPEPHFQALTASLHDALIAPLKGLLAPFHTVVVVPDDDLERVPYSALYDRAAGKYMVETRTTFTDYSAALFVQSASRYTERAASSDAMVVVRAAAPGPQSDALPEADREARAVAALFPGARVISAHETDSAVVLKTAAEATMLHFAGHGASVGNDSRSALRLGDDALLAPADFVGASMPLMRIAYLSACDTDNGPILKAEGSATIARAFFAAGVPVVVATLWPVEDSTARSVARVFYERLRAGAAPADALRDAQLSVLSNSTGSRADWAAFRIIGAGIPFEKRSS